MPAQLLAALRCGLYGNMGCRFADNLELDLPSLTSGHVLAGSHGNNVDTELAQHFIALLPRVVSKTVAYEFLKELYALTFAWTNKPTPHFLQQKNQGNRCAPSATPKQLTRYISIKGFFWLFLNTKRKFDNPTRAVMRREVDYFFDCLQEPLNLSFKYRHLPIARLHGDRDHLPAPAWVVPFEQAPHRRDAVKSLDPAHQVKQVVQWLGLPGYANAAARQEQMGLVAINFSLPSNQSLYKPTVLDALDSEFFLAAPNMGDCGLTQPLESSLSCSDKKRVGQGLPEYLCQPFTVPVISATDQVAIELIGFFAD